MSLVLTQLYLTADMARTVKRLARHQRKSMAQMVRELIDEGLRQKALGETQASAHSRRS